MFAWPMSSWLVALALATSTPALPTAPDPVTVAVAPDQVMALPPELRDRLHRDVLAGTPSQSQRLERIAHFMFDPQDGLGMTYQEDATYSVGQAYLTRQANCLSFTLLLLAMARESGLDVYPQEIRETLSWRQDGDIVYRNNHINAAVHIGGRQYVVDVAGGSVIARDHPVPVTDARVLSHYYNNLAV